MNSLEEVQQKYGRNMLLFLQMEGHIKFLVAHSNISSPLSKIKEQREQQTASLSKQTLGNLWKRFKREVLSDPKETEPETEEQLEKTEPATEVRTEDLPVSFNFRIIQDSDTSNKEIEAILDERNELAHHFLEKFDIGSEEGTREAILYLDEQLKRLLPIYEKTQLYVTIFYEGRCNQTASFRIFYLLNDLAIQKSGTDGWVPLTTAANLLHKEAPNELKTLKESLGCSSLKKLVLAIEGFEVKEEPLNKGGVRVLYRVKPDTASAPEPYEEGNSGEAGREVK